MKKKKGKYKRELETTSRGWFGWLVLFFMFLYALGFSLLLPFILRIGDIVLEINPSMYILQITQGISGLILLISLIGVLFRKRIAYYLAILSLIFTGYSGMAINLVVEVFTPGIPSGPGGLTLDIFWYVVAPIGFVAYLFYELGKIKILIISHSSKKKIQRE